MEAWENLYQQQGKANQKMMQKIMTLSKVFGTRLSPSEIAKYYVPNTPGKAIIVEDSWPAHWKKFLEK